MTPISSSSMVRFSELGPEQRARVLVAEVGALLVSLTSDQASDWKGIGDHIFVQFDRLAYCNCPAEQREEERQKMIAYLINEAMYRLSNSFFPDDRLGPF